MAELMVPISPGELIDKITILEIKSQRMTDAAKLHNVRTELARAVYVTNDERAAIKKKINTRLGSTLVEEKSYADYTRKG